MTQSLQDRYAPDNACFGCGPANGDGLRIKSFVADDDVICTWQPQTMHQAFPGVLNGGIIGALLDCHSNWTAAYHLMRARGTDTPPCTVTAEYSIQLRRPTPTDGPVHLRAQLAELDGNRARITATLTAGDRICATCDGLFVAVEEGHPAFHRW
ncbi:MAG TPA: PaaI family thioesterase [bacterium]|nr:PaaI family thioesterase [bacterium]